MATMTLPRENSDDPIIYVPPAGADPAEAIAGVMASVPDGGVCAVDVETTGLAWSDTVRLIQLGSTTHAAVLDAADPGHRAAVTAALTEHLLSGRAWATAHNAVFDALHLHRLDVVDGLALLDHLHDTYTLQTLIEGPVTEDEQGGKDNARGLKTLTDEWLPWSLSADAEKAMMADWKRRGWSNTGKKAGWDKVDLRDPLYLRYSGCDVLDTARLAETLLPIAHRVSGDEVLHRERMMLRLAAQMQLRGFRVDLDRLAEAEEKRAAEQAERAAAVLEISAEVNSADARITNPNSGPQVAAALEEELGITLPDTKADTLKTVTGSRIAPAVLAYRKVAKTGSTYTSVWPRLVDEDDRLHPTVNPLKASTGRFSCSEPNMQNIPKALRHFIIADDGMVLIPADFSAVEVRVGGAHAGDEDLLADLQAGLDPYEEVAKTAFGVSQPTKEQRDLMKPVLLGRTYNRSAHSVAARWHADDPDADLAELEERARRLMTEGVDQRYPALRKKSKQIGARVGTGCTGIVMMSGRGLAPGRTISIDPVNGHKAFNALVQGSSRELLVDVGMAMVEAGLGEYIWLSVHDEWILQVPEAEAEKVRDQMTELMTSVYHGVPIRVEAKIIGTRWGKVPEEDLEVTEDLEPRPETDPEPEPDTETESGPAPEQPDTAHLIIHSDGSTYAEGGYGAVVATPDGQVLAEIAEPLVGCSALTGVAEYSGLIAGLEKAVELGAKSVHCYADSQFMVRQMTGIYGVRAETVKPLNAHARQVIRESGIEAEFTWVPREENTHADRLARIGAEKGANR